VPRALSCSHFLRLREVQPPSVSNRALVPGTLYLPLGLLFTLHDTRSLSAEAPHDDRRQTATGGFSTSCHSSSRPTPRNSSFVPSALLFFTITELNCSAHVCEVNFFAASRLPARELVVSPQSLYQSKVIPTKAPSVAQQLQPWKWRQETTSAEQLGMNYWRGPLLSWEARSITRAIADCQGARQ
jgi:hypothetical protein